MGEGEDLEGDLEGDLAGDLEDLREAEKEVLGDGESESFSLSLSFLKIWASWTIGWGEKRRSGEFFFYRRR